MKHPVPENSSTPAPSGWPADPEVAWFVSTAAKLALVISGLVIVAILSITLRSYDPSQPDTNLGQGLAAIGVIAIVGLVVLPAVIVLRSRRPLVRKISTAILALTASGMAIQVAMTALSWLAARGGQP